MARVPEAESAYAVADAFRERCLIQGTSLLWPDLSAWSLKNLDQLWRAFVGNPDESADKSFLEKW